MNASAKKLSRIENLVTVVRRTEPHFNELAKLHNTVQFKQEASFAIGILRDNMYLQQVAFENKESLRRAVINVAAIGLTLNPVLKLAYLVPRKDKICLDISYRGFAYLAKDSGAIQWVQAELVCENDIFEHRGVGEKPLHKYAFDGRGAIIGTYCVAKTPTGDFLSTLMSLEDVYHCRERSPSYQEYLRDKEKTTPWVTDEGEMIKKTVVRRAYKLWPITSERRRLDLAVEISNEAEGLDDLEREDHSGKGRAERVARIRSLLKNFGRSEGDYLEHLMRVHRREIKKLEELTELESIQSIAMLQAMIEAKTNQSAAKKGNNENVG